MSPAERPGGGRGFETPPGGSSDVELLRRFEPICRFTEGENYFPMAVDEFVKNADLWLSTPKGDPHLLVARGELDLDTLAQYDEIPPGNLLYLNLVDQPLSGPEYQAWKKRRRTRFNASGRLARVPLIFRLGDLFFDLSFVLRGEVPGGFAGAADQHYERLRMSDPRFVYYGRVLRKGYWYVLHYNFYFSMNDWRSSFHGMNDHESDWEQVFVYVYEDANGELHPRWVAYAAHNFQGDDLRRRWDDPLLVKVGEHPVVYTAAGSHASYFEAGEYLIGITPEFLRPVENSMRRFRGFWFDTLGMGRADGRARQDESGPLLAIPHVDYARGDGASIGPGQDEEWTPILISDDVPWVDRYRGLWGLSINDPTGSERPPAGPKYNRDGSVRQSWHDPVGWAGMHKEMPPDRVPQAIADRIVELEEELRLLEAEIAQQDAETKDSWLGITALHHSEYNDSFAAEEEEGLSTRLAARAELEERRVRLYETVKALRSVSDRATGGREWVSPTAHLRNIQHPEEPLPPNRWVVDIWAAISGAVAFAAVILLLVYRPHSWPWFACGVFVLLAGVEALTRRRFADFLLNVVVVLAIVAVVILVAELWQWILVAAVLGVAAFMIVGNLAELRD